MTIADLDALIAAALEPYRATLDEAALVGRGGGYGFRG
jgi:hypothetical protein